MSNRIGFVFIGLASIAILLIAAMFATYIYARGDKDTSHFQSVIKAKLKSVRFKLKEKDCSFEISPASSSFRKPALVTVKLYNNKESTKIPSVPLSEECQNLFYPIVDANSQVKERKPTVKSLRALLLGKNQLGKSAAAREYAKSLSGRTVYLEMNAAQFRDTFSGCCPTDSMIKIIEEYYLEVKKQSNYKKINFVVCIDEVDNKDLSSRDKFLVDLPRISELIEKLFPEVFYEDKNAQKNNALNHFIMCGNNAQNFKPDRSEERNGMSSELITFLQKMGGGVQGRGKVHFHSADNQKDARYAAICIAKGECVERDQEEEAYNTLSDKKKRDIESVSMRFQEAESHARDMTTREIQHFCKRFPNVERLNENLDSLCDLDEASRRTQAEKIAGTLLGRESNMSTYESTLVDNRLVDLSDKILNLYHTPHMTLNAINNAMRTGVTPMLRDHTQQRFATTTSVFA